MLWHSDEAREWPTVEDGTRFGSLCLDCYGARYGADEVSEYEQKMRDEQRDDRAQ